MSEFLSVVERFPYAGLFLLPILGSVGFPLPEDAILLLSGVLIARNVISVFPGLAAVYSGILVSDLVLYSIGKKYCRGLLTHRRLQRIFPPEKLILLEQRFVRSGPLLILICRQIFWLRAKMFLAAGIMKMPLHRFLIVDAIAASFTVGIIATLGYAGGRSLQFLHALALGISRSAPPFTPLAALLLAALLVIMVFYRRQKGIAGV